MTGRLLDGDLAGDAVAGVRVPMTGSVTNLDIEQTAHDSVNARWNYDVPNPSAYQLDVCVDGSTGQRVSSGTTDGAAAGLSDGQHTCAVYPHVIGMPAQSHRGALLGQRAYLQWTLSVDATTTAYKVYQDAVLVDTIEDMVIEALQYSRLGTSFGRISTAGAYASTAPCNLAAYLLCTVSSSGITLSLYDSDALGTLLGQATVTGGQTVILGPGVQVTLHDDTADYTHGQGIAIRIGPRCWWLSEQLDPGAYAYTVTALDAAGNESSPLTARTVTVQTVPAEMEPIITWDADLSVWGIDPHADEGDFDTYNVYSNYIPSLGALVDDVCMDAPTASLNWDVGWSFDQSMAAGTLRFYLRPVLGGVERESLTLYTLTLPPTAIDLGIIIGNPTNLVLTALAAGRVQIEWDYRLRTDDDCATFSVELADNDDYTGATTVSVAVATGTGYPVLHFTQVSDVDYAGLGWVPVYVRVTALTSASVACETPAEDSVTPDATAPSAPSSLLGGSQ